MPDRRPRRNVAAPLVIDIAAVAAGWLLFNVVRSRFLPAEYVPNLATWLGSAQVLLGQFIIPVFVVLLYGLCGYYNRYRPPYKSIVDVILNTLGVSAVGMLVIFFTVLVDDDVPERMDNYEMMLILFLCLFIPVFLERCLLIWRPIAGFTNARNMRKALIVHATADMRDRVLRLCRFMPDRGYKIVGVHVDDESSDISFGLPICKGPLSECCKAMEADAVIMPVCNKSMLDDKTILDELYRLEMPVYVTPFGSLLLQLAVKSKNVRGEIMYDIASPAISGFTANVKRLSDVLISSVALILLSPVFLCMAIIVKSDSKGPVFYKQNRLGLRRKHFKIIKFRSMYTDAEKNGPALTHCGDSRITRSGRWLRKYHIDELPQFLNVLLGQMSIVGPRPERECFAEQILLREPSYMLLQQVRPGITSLGMVKYGYASDVDQMIERMYYDMMYIRNISMAIDIKVFLSTVTAVADGKGL